MRAYALPPSRQPKSENAAQPERADEKGQVHGEPDRGDLKECEAGVAVAEVCRKHGISAPTYYAWKSKYSRATASGLTRMREPEVETARLKRMYPDLGLENAAIKDAMTKRF